MLSSMSRRYLFSRQKSANDLERIIFEMTKSSDVSRKTIVDRSREIYYRHFRSRNISFSPQMLALSNLSRRAMKSSDNDIDDILNEFRERIDSKESVTAYVVSGVCLFTQIITSQEVELAKTHSNAGTKSYEVVLSRH